MSAGPLPVLGSAWHGSSLLSDQEVCKMKGRAVTARDLKSLQSRKAETDPNVNQEIITKTGGFHDRDCDQTNGRNSRRA
jgi:hypothetical protein